MKPCGIYIALVALALGSGCSVTPAATAPATRPAASAQKPIPVIVEGLDDSAASAEPEPEPEPGHSKAVETAVTAKDRSNEDRALDDQRKPVELFDFFGIAPGQKVAELGAGGGYTAELLARIVGPKGIVYGQNSPWFLERFAEGPWSERLKKPVMGHVVRLDTEFNAPFPEEVDALDAVLIVLFYHDTVWRKVDRSQMNAAVYRALKPGGTYGIVDHSARAGDGLTQTQTLHRIEESNVVAEIEAAGFKLVDSGNFLRNPNDPRDWNASPRKAGERRGTSDRFVLKFEKPGSG